ncbi:MAG: hypothetical protein RIR91_1745 [Verrucomicrobiota bacterium]|jgi:hypothetical protein
MVRVVLDQTSVNKFIATLQRFASKTGQTMRDATLEQAALICQDAATFTPPMPKGGGRGLSKAAQTAGDNAVAGDIRKIFVAANDRNTQSASALLTNQLAYATKANDISLFNNIIGKGTLQALKGLSPIMRKIANDQDHDRAFKKAKNYFNTTNPVRTEYGQGFVQELRAPHNRIKGKFGGRIGKNVRPTKIKLLVETKGDLASYIKERQAMVGMVKSGWASALRSLPKPKINGIEKNFGTDLLAVAWINRHATRGTSNVASDSQNKLIEVSVTNSLGNVNNIGVDASVIPLVLVNRRKQMGLRMRRHLKDASINI